MHSLESCVRKVSVFKRLQRHLKTWGSGDEAARLASMRFKSLERTILPWLNPQRSSPVLAGFVLVLGRERSAPLRHIGLFQYARYPGTRVLMRYRDVDAHTNKLSRVLSPQARLPTTSGVWTDPRWVPVGSKT